MDYLWASNVFIMLTLSRAIIQPPTVYIAVYFSGATLCKQLSTNKLSNLGHFLETIILCMINYKINLTLTFLSLTSSQ